MQTVSVQLIVIDLGIAVRSGTEIVMEKTIQLSNGEWKLMNLLWEEAPRTITQIVSASKEDMAWSKHTVIKMLSRMEAKGAVYFQEGEKAKQYYPAVDKTSIIIKETENFLDRVYGGRLGLLVNAMVKEKGISKAELDELHEILKQAEEKES